MTSNILKSFLHKVVVIKEKKREYRPRSRTLMFLRKKDGVNATFFKKSIK